MSRRIEPQARIQFLDEQSARDPREAEFVGGPRAGRQATPSPDQRVVALPDGEYVRSVRCADDGAVRFVWHQTTVVGGTTSGEIA